MKQIYVIPFECVEHLIDEDGVFKDREKVKKIGSKCGEIYSTLDFEVAVNTACVDTNESIILID